MGYTQLQQMRKQAATASRPPQGTNAPKPPIPGTSRARQDILYRDANTMPGGTPAAAIPFIGSPDMQFQKQRNDAFRAGDPGFFGASTWRALIGADQENPLIEMRYPWAGKSLKIDANNLPSAYAGNRLLAASKPPANASSSGTAPASASLTSMPHTNQQLMEMEVGDPRYMAALFAHYDKIGKNYWDAINLRLSPHQEREAWRGYVPILDYNAAGPTFNPAYGTIAFSPKSVDAAYDNMWNYMTKNPGLYESTTGRASFGGPFYTSASRRAALADSLFHEWRHMMNTGRVDVDMESIERGDPIYKWNTIPYDPSKPASPDNLPAVMRPVNLWPLLFTEQQRDWAVKHGIDPYILDEMEMNQAVQAMNTGRWALKQNREKHKDNTNYSKIDNSVWDKFNALPDFIAPGKEGREQFENMMQFFIENPQMRSLMPEHFRLVGYYQNLKAAIENSEDPEEKRYFQNLMDYMIGDRSFMAEAQPRPAFSYTDVQRMRA